MGIFSHEYSSISELRRGTSISIPDDSSNAARALTVLESSGIIGLDPFIDRTRATLSDIVHNPRDVRIMQIAAHNLVSSLRRYEISVINGNYALSGGLSPSEALYIEALTTNYVNIIAVRTEDLNQHFVRDIIAVIHSDTFRDIISDPDGKYVDFQRPHSFFDEPFLAWREEP
jgi:D-methionine transport system substrate-binding protein